MKITIDTKTDSHEEIKRAIQLLSYLVKKDNFNRAEISRERIMTNSANINIGENLNSQNTSNNNESNSNAFANMFGNSTEKKEELITSNKTIPDTPPDFNSFLNLVNNNEEKKEDKSPKITLF